jgi:hypothetical protein
MQIRMEKTCQKKTLVTLTQLRLLEFLLLCEEGGLGRGWRGGVPVHAASRKWPARATKYSHAHTYRMINWIEMLCLRKIICVVDPDPVGSA